MSTCVLYVDESGDVRPHNVPLLNGQTPIFTLTGLVLPLAGWRNIDREHLALKKQFFDPEITLSSKRPEYYEVKGNTLASPRNSTSRRRHTYIRMLFELISRYDGKLLCVTNVKNHLNPANAKVIYTTSMQIILERFNTFIHEHPEFDKGIIIADSTKRFDRELATSHMSYVFGNETGRQLINIFEAPLFADSTLTVGLQLVDNFSSLIYSNHYYYYCRNIDGATSYGHMQQYWQMLNAYQFKSQNRYDGYIMNGFRVVKHQEQ